MYSNPQSTPYGGFRWRFSAFDHRDTRGREIVDFAMSSRRSARMPSLDLPRNEASTVFATRF